MDSSSSKLKTGRPADIVALSAVQQYARELKRYLTRRLSRPQDVDDLAQEVYLRLLRVDSQQLLNKPLAFFYGVAAHVVADHWADGQKEERCITFDSEAVAEWSDDIGNAAPGELDDDLNIRQQIERALAELPPTYAVILLLHKRDGLSYEEISRELGLSVNTVHKYLTRSLRHIRMRSWET